MEWKNSSQIVLALMVSCGFFSCMFYMLKWGFPAENKDALNSLLSVLTTIFTLQMNFFFGSTSSSKAKDETISEIAKAPMPPAVPPINIPNADTVSVQTKDGDVTVNPKETI